MRLRPPDDIERDGDPLRARYVRLLTHAATAGEPPHSTPLDGALALCDALAGRDLRPAQVPHSQRLADAGGHSRPFHAGLVAHALGLADRLRPGSFDAPALLDAHRARVWRDTLTYGTHAMLHAGRRSRASEASEIMADVWDELATITLGGSSPATTLGRVIEAQDPRGPYFTFDGKAGDNPEPWWYAELVVLHAVATYAVVSGNEAAADSARLAAAFHHAETQPDHATSQPWALHAFLSDANSLPTADLLLLAATAQQPASLGVVPRVLLADAAVCLSAYRSA